MPRIQQIQATSARTRRVRTTKVGIDVRAVSHAHWQLMSKISRASSMTLPSANRSAKRATDSAFNLQTQKTKSLKAQGLNPKNWLLFERRLWEKDFQVIPMPISIPMLHNTDENVKRRINAILGILTGVSDTGMSNCES